MATRDPQTGEPYADDETGQPIRLFEKFVVLDVFHYMNTVIPQGFGTDAANTSLLRAELFNAYEREFVKGSLQPSFRESVRSSRIEMEHFIAALDPNQSLQRYPGHHPL